MLVINCLQGSEEWAQCRLGTPTASEFSKIITPAKMEPSRSADDYINKLIAEWLTGKAEESFQSEWMKRGQEVEEEARDYYSFAKESEVTQVGFCFEDAKRFGCSPDGLIEGGGLEIKCCSPGVHTGHLIANKVPIEYKLQILGNILVTGRSWWDLIIYHPDIDPLIIRTYKNEVEDDLKILEKALISTNKKIYDKKQALIQRGMGKAA